VIAAEGVAGTTHRKVALAADVPLGSMTYHFSGLDAMLAAAFERLAATVSARFAEALGAARTQGEAREAVVEIITGDACVTPRDLLLSYELYAFAARHPALRLVMQGWMARSRQALEQHFGAATARALDALIEGLLIHRSVDAAPAGRDEVRAIVEKLTR
jgi:DNA-binding transcriptional regulator YbjK